MSGPAEKTTYAKVNGGDASSSRDHAPTTCGAIEPRRRGRIAFTDRNDQIVQLYKAGALQEDICRLMDTSRGVVRGVLDRAGIRRDERERRTAAAPCLPAATRDKPIRLPRQARVLNYQGDCDGIRYGEISFPDGGVRHFHYDRISGVVRLRSKIGVDQLGRADSNPTHIAQALVAIAQAEAARLAA